MPNFYNKLSLQHSFSQKSAMEGAVAGVWGQKKDLTLIGTVLHQNSNADQKKEKKVFINRVGVFASKFYKRQCTKQSQKCFSIVCILVRRPKRGYSPTLSPLATLIPCNCQLKHNLAYCKQSPACNFPSRRDFPKKLDFTTYSINRFFYDVN